MQEIAPVIGRLEQNNMMVQLGLKEQIYQQQHREVGVAEDRQVREYTLVDKFLEQ